MMNSVFSIARGVQHLSTRRLGGCVQGLTQTPDLRGLSSGKKDNRQVEWHKNLVVFQALIEARRSRLLPANVNATDACGYSPLMRAAHEGDGPMVRRLIAAGANVRQQTPTGMTAFRCAELRRDNREVIEILKSEGAEK